MTTDDDRVPPTYWVLVFTDWRKADADVTVYLRGGAALSGKVADGPGPVGQSGQVDLVGRDANAYPYRHTIDLTEIAAVTATARSR